SHPDSLLLVSVCQRSPRANRCPRNSSAGPPAQPLVLDGHNSDVLRRVVRRVAVRELTCPPWAARTGQGSARAGNWGADRQGTRRRGVVPAPSKAGPTPLGCRWCRRPPATPEPPSTSYNARERQKVG